MPLVVLQQPEVRNPCTTQLLPQRCHTAQLILRHTWRRCAGNRICVELSQIGHEIAQMSFRIGLFTQDSKILCCSAQSKQAVEVFDVGAAPTARVAHWRGSAPASALAGAVIHAIRKTRVPVIFGKAVKDSIVLDIASGRTADQPALQQLCLYKDQCPWKQALEGNIGCLPADEQDSAVLPGVALVYWSQGDPWASYTQLPLAALKDHHGTLAPLLPRTLGWQRRPDIVTIEPRSGVGRMLLSVWEENVDWACPGGRHGEVLTFSDPAQGDDNDYTWIGSNGQERTVKRADMQVLLPVADPRARVKPSSPLHGVRLRPCGGSTHLAEVTLQQAAEAARDKTRGVLYYRLQNLLAGPGEPWLLELLSAEGRQQAAGEGLELWAASVSEADAPLVVARKVEAEGMGAEAGDGSSSSSSSCKQTQRRVVHELGVEERRRVMEKALGKERWRDYMDVDDEAQAGGDGGGLALAPDALLLLVHHHYLAAPFSRQLLQQTDRAIVELWEAVGRQQQQQEAVGRQVQQEQEAGPQGAAAGDAGAQSRAPTGGAAAGAHDVKMEDNGAGPSGSHRQAGSCPRAPKRVAQGAVEGGVENGDVASEPAAKRARQAGGKPSDRVAAAAANTSAQKPAAAGVPPQQQQQQHPPATIARPPAAGAAPHAPPPLFEYPLVGTRAAQLAGEQRRVRVLEDNELHLAERDEAEQQLVRLRQEHDAMQQEMRLGRAAAEDHVRELQAQLDQLQRERIQQQQVLRRERDRADAAEGDALRMREQRDQLHAQRECMRRQRDRMQGQGDRVQQEPEAVAAADDTAAKLQDEQERQRARAAAAEQEAGELRAQEQRRYEELQGKYEEMCDKHLQLLARHEEVLGDRGALQQQLTAAEQRAVAAEREAMQAQRGRDITA